MHRLATSFCAVFLLVVTASVPASGQANGAAPAGSTSQWQWRSVQAQGEPHARHENSMAAIGERLYVLGGRGERPLDIFDTRTRRWSRGSAPPLAVNHAQAAVWAGKLYLVGGFTGDYPNETALTHLLIYDPATDRWQVGAEIPADRRRGSAGTVAHDGVLYLVGGNTRGHNSGYVPWLDAFDTRTQRWTRLPDAPHARDHFQAVVLDGKLYAGGGRRSSHDTGDTLSQTIPQLDVYDLRQATWSVADATLPTPRAGAAAIAHHGRVMLLGGESTAQVAGHAEVESYDPATARWVTGPALPRGRHGTQAAQVGGDLYIAAGSGNRGGGPELQDLLVLPPVP
ncbi:ring canal kelch [Xanthomonas axonopodis pv. khayae]|uniref:Ring canal kelch n=1 Tax=Xanthomonas axonopodis pv. cajani TaxID=487827 RepID=A0ABX3MB82_9XANT|nr:MULTISPECIES: ring canal kelch [Xanthomonas]OOW52988.1 ring canal kelch [Xanthomonas campestris pv. centellae]OOW88608.1 ring canal kelch [Xanthomonas campestris pv. vitistrifoliae]OOW93906.1 ring canal kelch [Xanthomonas campestris pv. vitiscarnosae]OOW71082.1 ring canal kelch [Xanthomonas axonopodis pv. martyniicola]OOX07718.1 ring canal kelch [Xanthomonas axonopodis pv. khayae]